MFKAPNAEKCIILKRFKNSWQIIEWDIETDNVIEGETIVNKDIWIKGSAISPDGQYFYYSYDTYNTHSQNTQTPCAYGVVVSKIPNFTPLLFSNNECNRFYHCRFDEKTGLPVYNQMHELEQCGLSEQYKMIKNDDAITLANSGLLTEPKWIYYKGRTVYIDNNVVICDNLILYNSKY
jgi:hypothetical protein